MEQAGRSQTAGGHVRGRECVVGPGTMEEDPVDARRIENNGIGGLFAGNDKHAGGEPGAVGTQDFQDSPADPIVADFAQKPRFETQTMQGQPRIAYCPSRGAESRSDLDELPRSENPIPAAGSGRE